MKAAVYIQKGEGKAVCEDCVLLGGMVWEEGFGTFEESNSSSIIAIADGVGGNAGGVDAARFLLKALAACDTQTELNKEMIKATLRKINEDLLSSAVAIPGKKLMASTLSGIIWDHDTAFAFHLGNTRIYAVQGRYLKQITIDHTTAQILNYKGNSELALLGKNEITACMGGGNHALFDSIQVLCIERFNSFGGFVFTSDGIHDYVEIDDLEEHLLNCNDMQNKFNSLCRIAMENGSVDDKTILVLTK